MPSSGNNIILIEIDNDPAGHAGNAGGTQGYVQQQQDYLEVLVGNDKLMRAFGVIEAMDPKVSQTTKYSILKT